MPLICGKDVRLRMEVDVSPHNRTGHKFHIGQLVEFRPKKGSPILTFHTMLNGTPRTIAR